MTSGAERAGGRCATSHPSIAMVGASSSMLCRERQAPESKTCVAKSTGDALRSGLFYTRQLPRVMICPATVQGKYG